MRLSVVASPIGGLLIGADEQGLCAVGFDGESAVVDDDPVLRAAAEQLDAYFAGTLTEFDLPLSVPKGTDFERAVWSEMARIPYGQTRTYGELAAAVGEGGFEAARAVGTACNRNPLPIVVPCHRVVGAGRKLVGFGGGLHRKRFLLELEARVDMSSMLTGGGA
jgi:methylated-DNA-[protein]-cysteine S-methyltransferase